jgi:spore coat protein U-like protein
MRQFFLRRHIASLSLLTLIFSTLSPQIALAGTSTTNTKATATLAAMCNISMQNFSFGNITPGQPSSSATASLTAQCTKGSSYNITFLYHIWGTDCTYLTGTNSGDRFYYYLTSSTNVYVGNTVNQTEKGTGSTQVFNYVAVVQPATAPGWSNYSVCRGAVQGTYAPKNPGFNPYVTPDNYTDTNQVQITY